MTEATQAIEGTLGGLGRDVPRPVEARREVYALPQPIDDVEFTALQSGHNQVKAV